MKNTLPAVTVEITDKGVTPALERVILNNKRARFYQRQFDILYDKMISDYNYGKPDNECWRPALENVRNCRAQSDDSIKYYPEMHTHVWSKWQHLDELYKMARQLQLSKRYTNR